jgi:hypothetical protein
VDAAAVRAPKPEDFDGGPAAPVDDRTADRTQERAPERTPEPVPERPPERPPARTASESAPSGETRRLPPADEQIIDQAREQAALFAVGLPDFLVEQVTTRAFSSVAAGPWNPADVITAEVACVRGQEEYRNVRVNGQAARQPPEKSGAWTTGEFVTSLFNLYSSSTASSFKRRGEERVNGRAALVFEYAVDAEHSDWVLAEPGGQQIKPAYQGRVWIDKDTRKTLRLEQKALALPPGFSMGRAETSIEYGFVTIDGEAYLMPVRSESLGCRMQSLNCFKNTLEFKNYRKFGAASTIKYDK